MQLDLWDCVRASVSTLRGTDWAAGLSFHYNLGQTEGLFPKYLDVLPYVAPVDTEPLGLVRIESLFGQELLHAFKEQGFDLYTLRLQTQRGGEDILWMRIVNSRYRTEADVRTRIEHILASLNPSNVNEVVVVVEWRSRSMRSSGEICSATAKGDSESRSSASSLPCARSRPLQIVTTHRCSTRGTISSGC